MIQSIPAPFSVQEIISNVKTHVALHYKHDMYFGSTNFFGLQEDTPKYLQLLSKTTNNPIKLFKQIKTEMFDKELTERVEFCRFLEEQQHKADKAKIKAYRNTNKCSKEEHDELVEQGILCTDYHSNHRFMIWD